MTDQVQDLIFYKGEAHSLATEPLNFYKGLPAFDSLTTANMKGYTAVWAVLGDSLFLVSMSGYALGTSAVGIEAVFPGCREPVFADWYSGELRMQRGRLIEESEANPLYEYETTLNIEFGSIKGRTTLNREYQPLNKVDQLLFSPLEELLSLSACSVKKLKAAKIDCFGDLLQFTGIKLIKVAALDWDEANEIEGAVLEIGYGLGQVSSDWRNPQTVLVHMGIPEH